MASREESQGSCLVAAVSPAFQFLALWRRILGSEELISEMLDVQTQAPGHACSRHFNKFIPLPSVIVPSGNNVLFDLSARRYVLPPTGEPETGYCIQP